MWRRYLSVAGVLLFLLSCAGCGAADGLNRGGELAGAVTVGGKAIGGGRVEIFSQDGKHSVSCQIKPDGSYVLAEPPLGPCKLTVKTSYLKGMPPIPKTAKGPTGKIGSAGMIYPTDVGFVYTPIPAKYEDLSTTDLAVTVEPGKQAHDIHLAPKG